MTLTAQQARKVELENLKNFVPFSEEGYKKFYLLAKEYLTRLDAPTAGEQVRITMEEFRSISIYGRTLSTYLLPDLRDLVLQKINELIASKLTPAPQNAAGDNWISVDKNKPEMWKWLYVAVDTKDAEVYRYFVQEANFYMDGQFFDSHHKPIKDVAFWKYKKTPSPPTATAEQDKK